MEKLVTQLGDSQTRFIKTVLTASIDHLVKFLCQRMEKDLTDNAKGPEAPDKETDEVDDDKEDMPIVIGRDENEIFGYCCSLQYHSFKSNS